MENVKQVIFEVEGVTFPFPKESVPTDSMLYSLCVGDLNKDKRELIGTNLIIKTVFDKDQFAVVYNFLIKGIYPKQEDRYILDYFCINEYHSYELASMAENQMRGCMYQKGFESHEMNTNNYYELVTIDENIWKNLKTPAVSAKSVLYDFNVLTKRSWEHIQTDLREMQEIIKFLGGNCLIAGGRVFNTLFDTKITNSDFDIFIYGCDQQTALDKITLLSEYLHDKYFKETTNDEDEDINRGNWFKVVRTANALTIRITLFTRGESGGLRIGSEPEYQVIFRLYRTASEVLHGFDVDCCSMGYDGQNIIMTKRCMYSLLKGYNTVNFDRMSPSYELRLAKYGSRGMAVYIPGFDSNKINNDTLSTFHQELLESYNANYPKHRECDHYRFMHNLKGLDILLYLEYRLEQSKFNKRMINKIRKLCEAGSDYSSKRYAYQSDEGNVIESLISWLYDHRVDLDIEEDSDAESGDPLEAMHNKLNESIIRWNKLNELISIEKEPGRRVELIEDREQLYELILTEKRQIQRKLIDELEKFLPGIINPYNYESSQRPDPKLNIAVGCTTNTISKPIYGGTNMTFDYLQNESSHRWGRRRETLTETVDVIINFPLEVYNILKVVKPWAFDPKVVFKTTNPGEQMTNTFHKSVYEDHKVWYQGKFYKG